MSSKETILVTGFKPFHRYACNSSQEIVEHLSALSDMPGIECHVLDVTYKAVEKFVIKLRDRNDINAVIMLGLRNDSDLIGLERIAINMESSDIPDENGIVKKESKIEFQGPDGIFSTLPILTLRTELNQKGFSSGISNSAGTFVCNSIFYRTLFWCADKIEMIGFVHLPPINSKWSMTRLYSAVKLLISTIERNLTANERD